MKYGRLPWLRPEELDDTQRELYDRIVGAPRGQGSRPYPLTDELGRLHGVFGALLLDPVVGEAVQQLGSVTRTIWSRFPESRTREIAILTIARSARSEVEWHSHSITGSAAGLTEAEIASILAAKPAASFSADELLMWRITTSIVEERDLDDELFEQAESTFGYPMLMDLMVMTGYYEMLARQLRVWRIPLPAGVETVFGS